MCSTSLDGLVLLKEADNLLNSLKASRVDFETIHAQLGSVSRSLPSRPPALGGMAPAAQWGSEFHALSKQFIAAVKHAEGELRQLYGTASDQLNSPLRTPDVPKNLLDVLLVFADALALWIEYRRRQKG